VSIPIPPLPKGLARSSDLRQMFDRHQSTCCASFGIGVGEHEWRRSTVPARIQILPDETLRRRAVSKPITSIGRGLERKVAADA
jgi:hypothetical protein